MIKNIFANIVSRIWGFLSVFIFTPFYIKTFGLEQFGIISFYLLLTALLYFLDMGLSASVNREFARNKSSDYLPKLLSTVEGVYGMIMLLIILVFGVFPSKIVKIFDNAASYHDISQYIIWIGIAIALNLFLILYKSALMGMELQVAANFISILSNLSRYAFPFLLFIIYEDSLQIYFWWQVLSNFIFILIYKYKLYKVLGKVEFRLYKPIITDLKSFALGMMILSVISAINSQLDKFLTLEILGLTIFSLYTIASSLARIPEVAVSPLTYAVLPRLTRQYAEGDMNSYSVLLRMVSMLLVVAGSIISAFIVTNAKLILTLWVGEIDGLEFAYSFTKMLTIGTLFLLLQIPFYLIAVSIGKIQYHRNVGIITALILVPLIYACYGIFGTVGVALPWLFLNVLGFVLFAYIFIAKTNFFDVRYLLFRIIAPCVLIIFIFQLIYIKFFVVSSSLQLIINLSSLLAFAAIFVRFYIGRDIVEWVKSIV